MRHGLRQIWSSVRSSFVLQAEEYRASIQGLNLFFGAIIGVSFASAESLPVRDYAALLFLTAAIVMIILIVSNTRRRIYSVVQLVAVMAGAWVVLVRRPFIEGIPPSLFPTLAIWSLLAALTEFTPREKDARDGQDG